MRAKLIENISFKRGEDPYNAMDLGLKKEIEQKLEKLNITRNRPIYQWDIKSLDDITVQYIPGIFQDEQNWILRLKYVKYPKFYYENTSYTTDWPSTHFAQFSVIERFPVYTDPTKFFLLKEQKNSPFFDTYNKLILSFGNRNRRTKEEAEEEAKSIVDLYNKMYGFTDWTFFPQEFDLTKELNRHES